MHEHLGWNRYTECTSLLIKGDEEAIKHTRFRDRFEDLHRLADYYCESISTFAEMCLGRNYKCIYHFERSKDSDANPLNPMRYEMLVSQMANRNLPDKVRAAFTTLLLRLYVDRYPHSNVQAPVRLFVLDDKTSTSRGNELSLEYKIHTKDEMKLIDYKALKAEPEKSKPKPGFGSMRAISDSMRAISPGSIRDSVDSEREVSSGPSRGSSASYNSDAKTNFIVSRCCTRTQSITPKTDDDKSNISDNLLPQFRIPSDGPLATGRVTVGVPLVRLHFLLFGVREDQKASDKFALIQEFITNYLKELKGSQNPKNTQQNTLIGALLDTIKSLVDYGFIATYREINEMVNPLVALLNGKGDYPDDTPLAVRTSKDEEGNMLLFSSKQRIVGVLLAFNRLRDSYRLGLLMSCFQKSFQETYTRNGDSRVQPRRRWALGYLASKGGWADPPDADGGSDRLSPPRGVLLEHALVEVASETKVEGDVKEVAYRLKDSFQRTIDDIFEDDHGNAESEFNGGVLDLDNLSPNDNLSAICLDLMQYDSPELFEAAFSLLVSQYFQREPIQRALSDVRLLASSKLVDPPIKVFQEDPTSLHDGGSITAEIQDVAQVHSFKKLLDRGVEGYVLYVALNQSVRTLP
jgi:hypothetical protein